MSATFRGGRELSRRLDAITKHSAILKSLQLETVAEAKRLVPRKTGNLGRSIQPGYIASREALVHARARYAAYVEKGTRPHVIRAKNGKALRFPKAGTSTTLGGRVRTGDLRRLGPGAYTFAQKVNHPGTKPKPFLLPGARNAVTKGGMRDIVVGLWNEAA